MSTSLALPLSQWTPVATNCLNADGNFTYIMKRLFPWLVDMVTDSQVKSVQKAAKSAK